MHLGITHTTLVLGGAGRGNDGGIHRRAFLQHQALAGQKLGDGAKDLGSKIVALQQVAKAQDADPVGDARGAAKAGELPVQWHIKQRLFHGHVRQAKPLLQKMDAQHDFDIKGWAADPGARGMRLDQRKQLGPRHHLLHLAQKHRLARAPTAQVKAKI